MKPRHLLSASVCILLAGSLAARADEAARYHESFENVTLSRSTGIYTNNLVKIAGWNQITDTFDYQEYDWYEWTDSTMGATYSINSSGNTGNALACAAQSGSTGGSPANYEIFDYIISPSVSGNIDFMVKLSNYNGSLSVRKATRNESTGKYEAGEEIAYEGTPATGAWNKISFTLTDPSPVAIRLSNAIIDDFYADTADVPTVRAMSLQSVSFYMPDAEEGSRYPSSSQAKLVMDTENKGRIGARINVTNTGNVALTPGTEGYSATLKVASSATATGNNVYATVVVPFDFTLQPGETRENVDIAGEFTTTQTRPNLSVFENFDNTYVSVGYFTVVPYIAALTIKDEGSTMSISSKDIGIYKGKKAFNLQFQNTGGAPLVITGTDNEHLAFVDELPITVAPSETSLLALEASGFDGDINTTVSILSNAVETTGTRKFPLKGYEVPGDRYFNSFDDDNPLEGWIMTGDDNKWTLGHQTNDKEPSQKLYNSTGTLSEIQSPRMHFEEGDKYGFMAYGTDKSSARLYVSYSTDRINWSDDYVIAGSSASGKDESFNNNTYVLNKYILTAPGAGDYYIRLESKYAAIDNFFGGVASEAPHDIALVSSSADGTKVNRPLTASATFANYKSEPETAYAAQLRIDGAVVATAEPKEIVLGTPATFDFSVIPHEPGTRKVSVALAFDDGFIIESAPVDVEIGEELESYEQQVNEMTASASYLPLYLTNHASMSDFIIPAGRIGLDSECDLTGLALLYYNPTADNYVKSDIQIWIANTEDEEIAEDTATAPDLDSMTLVYRSKNHADEDAEPEHWDFVSSTNTGMSDCQNLNFRFAEPFRYTGKNLRIFFVHRQVDKKGSSSYTFRTMSGLPDTQCRYKSQYSSTSKDIDEVSFSKTTSQPVILLDVYNPAATLSGRVFEKVEANNPEARAASAEVGVADAVVTVADTENPDIYYTATSDDDGNYTLKVFQPRRTYKLSVEGPEKYDKYVHGSTINFTDETDLTIDVEMKRTEGSGTDSVNAEAKAFVTVGAGFISVTGVDSAIEVFDMTGARVAGGTAGQTISLPAGVYVVKAGPLSAKVAVK